MKKLFRLFVFSSLLGLSCAAAVYFFWFKPNYPAYAKNFLVFNSFKPAPEKLLARLSLESWQKQDLPAVEHYRLRLNQTDDWQFNNEDITSLGSTNSIIITLETWGSKYWPNYRSNPLDWVPAATYDAKLSSLLLALQKHPGTIYLRPNPEMEVPGRFYPWQEYPSKYITAFQHIAQLADSLLPQAQMIWAPAGYPGCEEFYPGDQWVDAISISLQAPSENIPKAYPQYDDINYDLYRRLHRLRFFSQNLFLFAFADAAPETVAAIDYSALAKHHEKYAAYGYSSTYFNRPTATEQSDTLPFRIGVYDPNLELVKDSASRLEHFFINLGDFGNLNFEAEFWAAQKRGHDLIITLETIEDSLNVRDDNCLENLLSGKYDLRLKAFYQLINQSQRTVYLRFSQEMEIPIYRYPWQSKDPFLYIDAYRYFMLFSDSLSPKIKRVWGPAGDRGSLEWYPGNDVVDYISFAIYGLPDKNIVDPTKQEAFAAIYHRKSWRMRFAPKPIFITEFGVKGPEDYQKNWLLKATETINNSPELVGINYFNSPDVPQAWGDIEAPNWSISPATFRAFADAIERDYEKEKGSRIN
jgi:beta-mannanase